jgi:hypothetical protein
MSKLRVGYILDEGDQPYAVHDLFERSKASEFYSIELLIVQRTAKEKHKNAAARFLAYASKNGLGKAIGRITFAMIVRAERLLFARAKKYAPYFRRYGLDRFNVEKLIVEPRVSKSGFVYRYSDADLAAIKAHGLDILLRGGSGILRGGILDACRFGIASFHHADNSVNRGAPPGFWEVHNREPATGFIIQRLSEELDGGDVLFRGAIATSPTYVVNAARLYLKANAFMHLLLERIGRERALPAPEPKRPYAYPLYKSPAIGQQLAYLMKTAGRMGAKLLRKLRGHRYRWGVAYQFVSDWKDAVLWRSKVIPNPPHRFLADPFVVARDGRHVIFMEDYDFRTDRGKIVAYGVNKDGATPLGDALVEPFHLSYPYVFECDGALYMCPDTHEAREVRVYRCAEFPLKWELHKVLKRDISATDSVLFPHGGKWWMLANVDTSTLGDHSSELHVFSAGAFDSQDWRPHPRNPVAFDPRCARNAGLIVENGDIYRVFQVQDFDRYGAAFGIARITALSEEAYAEERVAEIPPKFLPGLAGAHSYAFAQGLLALDFVKFERSAP